MGGLRKSRLSLNRIPFFYLISFTSSSHKVHKTTISRRKKLTASVTFVDSFLSLMTLISNTSQFPPFKSIYLPLYPNAQYSSSLQYVTEFFSRLLLLLISPKSLKSTNPIEVQLNISSVLKKKKREKVSFDSPSLLCRHTKTQKFAIISLSLLQFQFHQPKQKPFNPIYGLEFDCWK